ncbi:hypothetical protein EWM64_g2240 [Hericium alpestre]|uniref:CHAT domain-containing protein n=1 Tax=Hericium alpestre TaxID=135208 RepID=A0A4Z0A697_9AGAM|nr:hypothetical protein EWM64_g2240 [Hericium alpestre]
MPSQLGSPRHISRLTSLEDPALLLSICITFLSRLSVGLFDFSILRIPISWRIDSLNSASCAMEHNLWFNLDSETTVDGWSATCTFSSIRGPDSLSFETLQANVTARTAQFAYVQKEDLLSLDFAIVEWERLVALTPESNSQKYDLCRVLGALYSRRHVATRDPGDADKAVFFNRLSADMAPVDCEDRRFLIYMLGSSHLTRFAARFDTTDAMHAATYLEQTIYTLRDGHEPLLVELHQLNVALAARYAYTGSVDDLDRSIALSRQLISRYAADDLRARIWNTQDAEESSTAMHVAADGRENDPHQMIISGMLLQERFRHSGEPTDIDSVVSALASAIDASDHCESDRQSDLVRTFAKMNLSQALHRRFMRFRDPKDSESSVSKLQEVLDVIPLLLPENVAQAGLLSNMGINHLARFDVTSDPADIEEAIRVTRQALDAIPEGHWEKWSRWCDLGLLLHIRFERFGQTDDLEEAHACHQRAVDGLPEGHQQKPRLADIDKAIEALYDAVGAATDDRPERVFYWTDLGYSLARRYALSQDPVDIEKAASVFKEAALLEKGSLWSTSFRNQDEDGHPPGTETADDAAPTHRRLAEEWEKLLQEARQDKGFERFLKPKQLSELRQAARLAPIVVLNLGLHCHALIVLADLDDVLHIPLDVTMAQAEQLRVDLGKLLTKSHTRSRLGFRNDPGSQEDSWEMQLILLTLWIDIVKPVLDALCFPVLHRSDPHPRLIWCPTGPLAFLPIHAAGDYSCEEPGQRTSDYVVSSYTSTISALLDASNRPASSEFRCLAVSQRDIPGLTSLPYTELEIQKVRERVGNVQMEELASDAATVAAVHDAMERCSWIHLACHAVQDSADPLKSAFCLADGRLQLQDIIRKTHPHADFAFLSACQTSTGDQKLSDEAVHLAAGMQLAGYRSVIATMWSIGDEDGPLVADEVYAHLLRDGKPDSSRAAHALHHSVLKLQETTKRDDRDDSWFLRWVPFIHIGA